ncbi:MAG: hypothetical protein OEX19_05615 [Gammaproteobacteria bacterium]|nr:hypothetical protein [Gammaproteobacteria bacterium]
MKITKIRHAPTFILLLGLTTACSSIYKNDYIYADYVSTSKHKQLAKKELKLKNYRGALVHFRILEALQPDDPEIKNRIRITMALASRKLDLEISKGMLALRNNKWDAAKQHFLKALNIQPQNKIALESLRKINAREVKEVQTSHLNSVKRKRIYLAETE